jgi:ferredoxin
MTHTTRMRILAESSDGRVLELAVATESTLLELLDIHDAPIPFCCRSASCGMCRIAVLEGGAALLPAADDELELLAVFDADPEQVRLACQAKLRPSVSLLRIRALEAR